MADLCNQAKNAGAALTPNAGKMTPAQLDEFDRAQTIADTICLDQGAAATSPTLEGKLRSTIPALVALIPVKE